MNAPSMLMKTRLLSAVLYAA